MFIKYPIIHCVVSNPLARSFVSFGPCQLFVGGVGGSVLKSGDVGGLTAPTVGALYPYYIREFVVVACTSSVARAQEPRASPRRCCFCRCGGRERDTHKSCHNFSFPSLWHNFRFVQKKICQFRRRTHQDEGEVSDGGSNDNGGGHVFSVTPPFNSWHLAT